MAQDEPLRIENSRSPDGSMELWIKPDPYTGEVACSSIAQIRELKSGRIVGTFHWAGFGERPDSTGIWVLYGAGTANTLRLNGNYRVVG